MKIYIWYFICALLLIQISFLSGQSISSIDQELKVVPNLQALNFSTKTEKRITVVALNYNTNSHQSIPAIDTLKPLGNRRVDAFSTRIMPIFFNEIALYYDRGINLKRSYLFSVGLLRPSDISYEFSLITVSIPQASILQGNYGVSLRSGIKYNYVLHQNSSFYLGAIGICKMRRINLNDFQITTYDEPEAYIEITCYGTSIQLGTQLWLGYQFYNKFIYLDCFIGVGATARRDFLTYTEINDISRHHYTARLKPGETSHTGFVKPDSRIVLYPSLLVGIKIGMAIHQ